MHGRLMKAESLDGVHQDDLIAIDREAARGRRLGDISRGNRAIELAE
jgi:hypothetical protein